VTETCGGKARSCSVSTWSEACRRRHFRTAKESKRERWRSHRGSRAIRRRSASEIGLAWLTARNRRYSWIAGDRWKRHVLADPRWRNMAQPGQLPVVGYLARSNQFVQPMGQRHNSRNPMRALRRVAQRQGRECGRRNTPAGWQCEFNLHGCCPLEPSFTVTAPVLPS
jgi:hypothetical protein